MVYTLGGEVNRKEEKGGSKERGRSVLAQGGAPPPPGRMEASGDGGRDPPGGHKDSSEVRCTGWKDRGKSSSGHWGGGNTAILDTEPLQGQRQLGGPFIRSEADAGFA